MRKTFILSLIISLTLSGCNLLGTKDLEADLIDRGLPDRPKRVEIYDLNTEIPEITIKTSGIIISDTEVNLAPQIAGRISELHAQIGDKVEKGDLIATLGDSLSTDLAQLQYKTALQSLDLSNYSSYLTDFSNEQSLDQANLSLEIAEENYYNAITARDNAEEQYQAQLESLELQEDNAEEINEDAQDAYEDLSPRSSITIDQAEKALDQTELAADLSEAAINILDANYATQIDQLNYAIEIAYLQCLQALNQLEMTEGQTAFQALQSEVQLLQTESGKSSAELSYQQRYLKAPQGGTITAITVKEGNPVMPGQVIVQIQNTDSLSAKTAISKEQSRYVDTQTAVYIDTDEGEKEGKITFLSPSLNPASKKIDLEVALNEESETLPGSFITVYFQLKTDKLIAIPLNTIFIEKGKKFVKIVNGEDKIEYKEVRIKDIIGDFAIIKSGLSGKEKIVLSVDIFLTEGEQVAI